MAEYGLTPTGFVIKRMDTILDEIHGDLSEGFGFDTRVTRPSFLDMLVTSFAGQIADLWEVAQDDYYAKYPSTAVGVSLDNSVQYGGIRRKPNQSTTYPIHCTGDDGTLVRAGAIIATDTKPEIRLYSIEEFTIERDSFNDVGVVVSAIQTGAYTVSINGTQYSYSNTGSDETAILNGLKTAMANLDGYTIEVKDGVLHITDETVYRSNSLILSDNLTTEKVTTIAQFNTEEYGRITLPDGIVTKIITNIAGFDSVDNKCDPVYGRLVETDIELRQSYIAKCALRSNTMIDSIVSELLNNVANVESASGYENDTDVTDSRGLPPHSIEIVVEGGDETDIAEAILRRKAGGIQTYGSISINVPTEYGDIIPIKFNRPEYLYTWIKVVLHGTEELIPTNYAQLCIDTIVEYGSGLMAGDDLIIQRMLESIYDNVAGISFVDITTAYSSSSSDVPESTEYQEANVVATPRQKILIGDTRIEVTLSEDDT